MGNKKKIFYIIILLITCSSLIIFLGKEVLGERAVASNEITVLSTIEAPDRSNRIIEKHGEGVLKYYEGTLFYYSFKGNEIWQIHLGIINPLIKSNDKSIYVLDNTKNQLIKLQKDGEIVYRRILETSVKHMEFSTNDFVAIQYINENRLNHIKILDNEGKKHGEIMFSEGEILNLAISSKERNEMIIHIITTDSGRIERHLITYDLKGNMISRESIEDIIFAMHFDIKNNLTIIHQRGTKIIDRKKNEKIEHPLTYINRVRVIPGEVIITSTEVRDTGGIIQGRNNSHITIFKKGKKEGTEIQLKERVEGIDVYNNNLLVHSNRSIYVFNLRGEALLEHLYNSEIDRAYIFPQKHIVIATKEKLIFAKFQ